MFSEPLHRRLSNAAAQRRRYRNDPNFRLAKLNANRERAGQPPLNSLDEIGVGFRAFVASRPREKGRFK